MKTLNAFIGALLGVVVALALGNFLGIGLLLAGIVVGVVLLCYIAAALSAGSGFGEIMRGVLIGLNAGLNVVLLAAILDKFSSGEVALTVAGVVGLLNFLAVFGVVANSEFYQGVIGWSNWIMPMSWLVLGIGLIFFLLSLLGHLVFALIFKAEFFRIKGVDVDWKTGTFFTHGGWISNLNPIDTAFNMGLFSYVDVASSSWHMEHEAGHTLNLAAFGSIFHFIGAVDENVTGGGANAFSERLAESNDPTTSQSNIIPMWI